MRCLVTGADGLLGSAFRKALGSDHIFLNRKKCNLLDSSEVDNFFNLNRKNFDTVIHCAGVVGGVFANMNANKEFFDQNYLINRNVLESSYKCDVDNLVSVLSTCVFPDDVEYPLTPDKINLGPPHESNRGYSYAKRFLFHQTNMFGKFLNKNWYSVIPTNMYGENDYFNLEKSHLIPALIRKAHESSKNESNFVVWGDGSPLRQFVKSDDAANLILWSIDNWKKDRPFMLVDKKEYAIRDVVRIIANKFNIPEHKVKYDSLKPNGQFRKTAASDCEHYDFVSLEDGISDTIDWYVANDSVVRK